MPIQFIAHSSPLHQSLAVRPFPEPQMFDRFRDTPL